MARRSVLQTTRGGRPERALCAFPMKNKCSTYPDFGQHLSIGRARRSSAGDTPALRGCAAFDGRRRGASGAPTWRRRAADGVRRRSRATDPGRRAGNPVLRNKEIIPGEQGANGERTGKIRQLRQGVPYPAMGPDAAHAELRRNPWRSCVDRLLEPPIAREPRGLVATTGRRCRATWKTGPAATRGTGPPSD